MKFTVERDTLLKAVEKVRSIVIRGTTIPILTHFKIEAVHAAGGIRLTATDLDREAGVVVAAHVEADGATCIPADKLHDILRYSPEGAQIAVTLLDARANIRVGRSNFSSATLPAEGFPRISEEMADAALHIEAGELRRLLQLGGFCAADTEERYYLMACYIATVGEMVRTVSTDGKQLSLCERAAPTGFRFDVGGLLPGPVIAVMDRLLANMDHKAAVDVAMTTRKIIADIDGVHLIAKLMDQADKGGWVTYEHLFSSEERDPLTLDTDLLKAAIQRCLIMVDRTGVIANRVSMAVEPGKLRLWTRSAVVGAGDASEEIEADWSQEERTFNFNGARIMELLDRIGTENVIVNLPKAGRDAKMMEIVETGDPDWRGLLAFVG